MSYDLDGWIAHGGPSDEDAREIRTRIEASLEKDGTGLNVRLDEGALRFDHQTGVFLLTLSP